MILTMSSVARELKQVLGPQGVLDKPEELLTYAYDASFHRHAPDLVVLPTDEEQVARIVSLANEAEIPVVPRGAGTGMTAGSVPIRGGIVVSMTRMNKVLSIDRENLTAVVQAGVVNGDFQRMVEDVGLFYPPDPQSLKTSTLGGNIAENAGGPRAFKYGVTRDYVLGLKAVSPTGKFWRFGGQTIKNVTAYDMTRLIIGSEGTLGIITEATMRLIPQPEEKRTVMAIFARIEDAGDTVSRIIASGIIPVTLEILDDTSMWCIEQTLHLGLPTDAEAILLMEVDGFRETVEREISLIQAVCAKSGVTRLEVATNPAESEKLWTARRAFGTAILRLNPTKVGEDATIPRNRITDFIRGIKEIAKKHHLKLALAGHAGDGNMHPNFMVNARDAEEMARLERAIEELFMLTIDLGGTLSGEHGIGSTKAAFLGKELNADSIEAMLAVKKVLDPKGIMNPQKIFADGTSILPFPG